LTRESRAVCLQQPVNRYAPISGTIKREMKISRHNRDQAKWTSHGLRLLALCRDNNLRTGWFMGLRSTTLHLTPFLHDMILCCYFSSIHHLPFSECHLSPNNPHESTELAPRYDAFNRTYIRCHVKVPVNAGIDIHSKCSKHDSS
jgi:hypothetical protein